MKKLILAFLCVSTIIASCGNNTTVSQNKLPKDAQTFITEHFPGHNIAVVEKDIDSFDVKLSNGWEVDFTKKGEWKSIDCKNSPVPASVLALLPPTIGQYISTNYPEISVVEISKDSNYDIDLSNDVDIEFSLNGDFLKID